MNSVARFAKRLNTILLLLGGEGRDEVVAFRFVRGYSGGLLFS